MHFDIRPYLGAFPITFGMSKKEANALLGAPESSDPIWNKSGFVEHYSKGLYNVGYDNDWVVNHLGFGPGVELSIQGERIWTTDAQPDPNPFFLALDAEPIEFAGTWSFLKIGVATTGYHDNDPDQLAVTVFPRAASGKLLAKGKTADTSKYRSI